MFRRYTGQTASLSYSVIMSEIVGYIGLIRRKVGVSWLLNPVIILILHPLSVDTKIMCVCKDRRWCNYEVLSEVLNL